MSKRLPTVRELAKEANIDLETAELLLMEANLEFRSIDDKIFRRDIPFFRRQLNLPKSSAKSCACEIQFLAQRAGKREEEVRKLLVERGIIKKSRLKSVPSYLLQKAENALGLLIEEKKSNLGQPTPGPAKKPKKKKAAWKTIGPIEPLEYISTDDVLLLHFELVKDFARSKDPIDPPGPRNKNVIDSAVNRQKTSLGETNKYPSVAMAAATLLFGIVVGHPFHNGNKRTGIVALAVFLDKNGWVLTCKETEIYDFLVKLAAHELRNEKGNVLEGSDEEVFHVAMWVQSKIKRVKRGEQPLPFRELMYILEKYGCTFERREGNRMNIRRGNLKTQVRFRAKGDEVDRNAVHKIRKDLNLEEKDGYDSDIFYNIRSSIPDFINKYRKLLNRLAKI